MFSKDGKGIKFSVSEVPFLGRGAKGVRGIKNDSSIVFASLNDKSVLYSKNGYFKYNDLKVQRRAGKGLNSSFDKMSSILGGFDFIEGSEINVFFNDNTIDKKELKLNSYLEKGTPLFKKSGVENVYLKELS